MKGRLSVSRLIAVNAVVAGLEIAACVAFTFIPPLLLKCGFSESNMSIVLGIAPFLALFTVPSLGKWSDGCESRLGRRRPFILAMSAILIVSLLILCVGQEFTPERGGQWWRMVFLGVGVVLLDYSSQAAINPCEALMSDMMVENQVEASNGSEEAGFTVYSGMLSIGACLGYLLTALDLTSLGITIGNKEQTAFILVIILYLICCVVTMLSAWEKPYVSRTERLVKPPGSLMLSETGSDPGYESEDELITLSQGSSPARMTLAGIPSQELILSGLTVVPIKPPSTSMPTTSFRQGMDMNRQLLQLRLLLSWQQLGRILSDLVRSPFRAFTTLFKLSKKVVLLPLSFVYTVHAVPPVLRTLFYTDLLSWIAIMAHGMFYTDFVAQAVYGGQPDAPSGSVYDVLFDEGVRMGSWGLLLHSITACLYAVFIQEHVTNTIGLKRSYQLGLLVFSVSMAVTVIFSSSIPIINLAAAASGTGYAVITTIPNTLVTMYHEEPDLYYGGHSHRVNMRGVGQDIAILDSGYFISQIVLSLIMGKVVEVTGLTHYYMIVSCVAGLSAAYLAQQVVTCHQDLEMPGSCPTECQLPLINHNVDASAIAAKSRITN